jgi:hypothetical protein
MTVLKLGMVFVLLWIQIVASDVSHGEVVLLVVQSVPKDGK